jgi:hypothetical protein
MKLYRMQPMIIIMIFKFLISYFLQKYIFVSLFCGLFNDETDLRVRYTQMMQKLGSNSATSFALNKIKTKS